ALLATAHKAISEADVVLFGGAPLFNYVYQSFYLRTIVTLEIAEEYGVPVLFSSIGVEPFNADSSKSLRLRKALHLPCVKQITTRDDFESLAKYMEGTETPIAHVADPAVLANLIFDQLRKKPFASKQKTVGLVVTRINLCQDNKISFSGSDQRQLWLDVIDLLEQKGYEYRLFTTGHFSDEAFLDDLVRNHGVPAKNAAITINSPEELIEELCRCDGVIAYRLHASITAFAYNIPSIGLTWNFKVPMFYQSVGYAERALESSQWTASAVVAALEQAMDQGVTKDVSFLMSVYSTLFSGFKEVLCPESPVQAFTYSELAKAIPRYAGTTPEQYRVKANRKMRRTYENFQKLVASVDSESVSALI
ncbi:MAG: polysaccharide pyruvyl transferase family protein, partial [Propionibacteriaceae bacterium]|nr:polysaccharide pyruvyl transferase family protein [Propionibacteriaceae bacterium]